MSANQPHILSIDLGTSGPKAALVGLDGTIAATAYRPVETLFLADGGAEQDGEAIWTAVKEAARAAVANGAVARSEVRGVICASQYSSVIPVDRAGRPVMNMVVWMDGRGAPKRLARDYPAAGGFAGPLQQLTWLRLHGLPPLPSGVDSLAHMRWIKFARPEVYDRTHAFLEPMDYVTMRLTGRATANQCSAFTLLLVDNRRLGRTTYSDHLLRLSGIDRAKLPALLPLDAIAGEILADVAADLGLDPGTPVVSGFNDTQTGAMASLAFRGSHGGLSIGTTSVLSSHMTAKRTSIRYGILSNPSPVPETYFLMAENGLGGKAVEHVLTNLIYTEDGDRFANLDRAVGSVAPGSGGVLFLPWLTGAMAPKEDARMRGGFLNLSLATTRAALARAALESVAFNLRWLNRGVEKFLKRRLTHLMFYGGGAQSDQWSGILADVLGLPIHRLANPRYANALGGGLLAFERLGLLGLDDFAARATIDRVFEPRPEHAPCYDRLFEQFVAAFTATRPICRALQDRGG